MDPETEPAGLTAAQRAQIAVEEYRFQVRLNARTNYWYTVNMAMFVAGAAVTGFTDSRWVPAAIFAATSAVALLCAAAVGAQHGYYHAARDRALDETERAGAPNLLRTTPGMRTKTPSRARVRIVKVHQWIFRIVAGAAMLAAIGILLASDPQAVLPTP